MCMLVGFFRCRKARKYVAGIYEAHEFLCIIFTSLVLLFKSQCSISLSHSLPLTSAFDYRMCVCVYDSEVIKNPMYANQCFSHPIAHQYSTRKSEFEIEFCVMNMWTLFCLFNDLFILFFFFFLQPSSHTQPLLPSFSSALMCSFLLLLGKNSWNMFDELSDFDWLAITLPPTWFFLLSKFVFELVITFKAFLTVDEKI